MKLVHAPSLGRTVKLGGRKRPVAHCPRLHLRSYLVGALPEAPPQADYSPLANDVLRLIYDNDTLGDCVIAAGYHVTGVETGNAGDLFTATDAQILADYSAIGGYVPGDPTSDNGCDEQTALNYWTQTGFANGTQLSGWASVDAGNADEIRAALFLFENLYFGIELPDAWITPFPSADGFVWDVAGAADPSNGHAVMGCGYDASGVKIDSWGMLGTLTYAAIAQYCAAGTGGELYVLLSPDQIAKGQSKAPNGALWSDLVSDLAALNGAPPAPPLPVPPPAPPTAGVTLAQAQVWAAAGLQKNWPSNGGAGSP